MLSHEATHLPFCEAQLLRGIRGLDALHPVFSRGSANAAARQDLAAHGEGEASTAGGSGEQFEGLQQGRAPSSLIAVVPRGDVPLNSYEHEYWPCCFPILFPYGDGRVSLAVYASTYLDTGMPDEVPQGSEAKTDPRSISQ
jgi:hypothetical protein